MATRASATSAHFAPSVWPSHRDLVPEEYAYFLIEVFGVAFRQWRQRRH